MKQQRAPRESAGTRAASTPDRQRRRAFAVLALLVVVFIAYAALFVPHLTNNFYADVEFTGWSGPIGRRIAEGARPYFDFVLPLPPGSFALLAWIGELLGRFRLLNELWLNALCQLGMTLLAYVIAVRFTTRQNALLVALCTLVMLLGLNKECAYDHTAQLVAWASVASGALALCSGRRSWWALTGLFAGFTLAFKQSTGIGAIFGWLSALAYLWLIDRIALAHERARRRITDGAWWLCGVSAGAGMVLALVLILGGPLGGFIQAVFVDGPKLKGGSGRLVDDLFGYLVNSEAFVASVGFLLGFALLGRRLVDKSGGLHLGDEPLRAAPLTLGSAFFVAALEIATFGTAGGMLLSHYTGIRPRWVHAFDALRSVPSFGLALVSVFFVVHLVRVPADDDSPGADTVRRGHTLNAVVIAALWISLLHNTSAPWFRAFYDNNPIIPLAFIVLFAALDRAKLLPVKILVVLLTLASLFGNRLDRALRARIPVGSKGYWAGMLVSPHGRDIVRAARTVRRLTKPGDTVLVLPEDVNLVGLIARPRPPIRGAIVFVDQYPSRLVASDARILAEHPPKVIVLNPKETILWREVFRIWSGNSGAERLIHFVEQRLMPGHYRLEASFPTHFASRSSTLQIWLRK